MNRWRVLLTGHDHDLEDLPRLFTADLRVVTEGGEYFVESPAFETLTTSGEVRDEAVRLLPFINGLARFASHRFQNVSVGSAVIENTPDGIRRHAFASPDTIRSRAKVHDPTIVVDGVHQVDQGPTDQDRWSAFAVTNDHVAEALTIWSDRPHDGTNLNKIFEIIGEDIVRGNGWASGTEIRRFNHSVNDPNTFGSAARHARTNTDPPRRPMTAGEAEAFVERLMIDWLNSMS